MTGLVMPGDHERALADAQETVAAIHQGTVDAVVVQGPDGPQIVLLHGAEEPYRVIVERMSDGAVTLASDGTILFANARLGDMIGSPAIDLVGLPIGRLFADALDISGSGAGEGHLLREHAEPLPVAFRMQPLAIGDADTTLVTLADLTVLRRAEETAAAERFARSILEQATDAIVVLGRDARITHASLIAEQLTERSPIGRRFSEAFPLDASTAAQDSAFSRLPIESLDGLLATKPFHGLEVKLRDRRFARRTFLLSSGPLLNDEGRAVGSIVTLTDITERKRAEEQQTVLVAELNHRVKNILAIVQSVAAQTVRSAGSLDAFSGTFAGRLSALSLAHDILTRTRWIGIGINELLASVLAPHCLPGEERITMSGPAVLLSAGSVLPLSMTLHELTTNAAKYGALSNSAGHVDVSWRTVGGGDDSVEMVWQERGGPPVRSDAKPGFGTRLIERVVAYDLEGTSTIDLAPGGLRCTVAFPIHADAAPPIVGRPSAIT